MVFMSRCLRLCLFVNALMLIQSVSLASVTVATFADPSIQSDYNQSMFSVYTDDGTIDGGWMGVGLDLEIPLSGHVYNNAIMVIQDGWTFDDSGMGIGGNGSIQFFASVDDINSAVPLLQIDFESFDVNYGGLHADDIINANNVSISGSEITVPLTSESVSFAFANQLDLSKLIPTQGPPRPRQGYMATSAMTISAVVVPEPCTLAILGLGALGIGLRRRKAV